MRAGARADASRVSLTRESLPRSAHAHEPSAVPDACVLPFRVPPHRRGQQEELGAEAEATRARRDLAPTTTEGYKVGQAKTLDELQRVRQRPSSGPPTLAESGLTARALPQLDAEDESLARWKASLGLGASAATPSTLPPLVPRWSSVGACGCTDSRSAPRVCDGYPTQPRDPTSKSSRSPCTRRRGRSLLSSTSRSRKSSRPSRRTVGRASPASSAAGTREPRSLTQARGVDSGRHQGKDSPSKLARARTRG